MVGWFTRITLRVRNNTMFKRFRCNLFKTNMMYKCTCWYGIVRLTWTIINWYHWIYNGPVSKTTQNNPKYLVRSRLGENIFPVIQLILFFIYPKSLYESYLPLYILFLIFFFNHKIRNQLSDATVYCFCFSPKQQ